MGYHAAESDSLLYCRLVSVLWNNMVSDHETFLYRTDDMHRVGIRNLRLGDGTGYFRVGLQTDHFRPRLSQNLILCDLPFSSRSVPSGEYLSWSDGSQCFLDIVPVGILSLFKTVLNKCGIPVYEMMSILLAVAFAVSCF